MVLQLSVNCCSVRLQKWFGRETYPALVAAAWVRAMVSPAFMHRLDVVGQAFA